MGWLVLLVVVMLGLIAYMKFSEYIASQRMERERDEHKESWIKPDAERKPITVSSDEKRVEKVSSPSVPKSPKRVLSGAEEVEALPIYRRRPSVMGPVLPSFTKEEAAFILDSIGYSTECVNNARMPLEFFEHWAMIFWGLKGLARIEKKLRFKGDLPSELLYRYVRQYDASTHDFLDRYAQYRWETRIQPLQTTRANLNRNREFLADLMPYMKDMTKDSRARAKELSAMEYAQIELEAQEHKV